MNAKDKNEYQVQLSVNAKNNDYRMLKINIFLRIIIPQRNQFLNKHKYKNMNNSEASKIKNITYQLNDTADRGLKETIYVTVTVFFCR